MKRLILIPVVSVYLMIIFSFSIGATQIIHMSPEQLGEESSLIVQGKVTGVTSYWNEQKTKIFTKTLVAIEETYKGERSGEVAIVQLGGVVGNVRINVSGALTWKPGEETLIFLERYDAVSYQISGFSQGKFGIERDPVNGRKYIKYPDLRGAEILGSPDIGKDTSLQDTKKITVQRFINKALGVK